MSGIFQDDKFWRRKLLTEDQPPRTSRPGGRRGCLGSRNDKHPGTYHVENCRDNGEKSFNDKLKNQRY